MCKCDFFVRFSPLPQMTMRQDSDYFLSSLDTLKFVRIKFSSREFIIGTNGGSFLMVIPIDSKTVSNRLLKRLSRS